MSVTYEQPDDGEHRIDLDFHFPDDSHLMFHSVGCSERGAGRLEGLLPVGVLKGEDEHKIVAWIDADRAPVRPFVVRMTSGRTALI